jgi:glycerol dehydrogenase-like iron-containing ADH family enzyme
VLNLVEFVSGAVPRLEEKSHLRDVASHVLQMTTILLVHDNFSPALGEGHHVSGKITVNLLEIYLHVERIIRVDSILAFSISILGLSMLYV